ncbi:MAG: class I SAM-dependent methyltransferase [Thermoflexales bacterium]
MNTSAFVSDQYRTPVNLQARIALHERFSLNPYDWMLWVLDQVGLGEDACVFEVGCGTGRLWKTNAHRLRPGWDITLSDQSAGMVAQARAALAGVAHPFRFEVCPADRIPREDASVDVAIANHMLYHVPDLPAALAEIRRVLKPGGALYAATNGAGHMRELDALYSDFTGQAIKLGMSLSFTLENGAELLWPVFPSVTLIPHVDALDVDDADALADYILSMTGGAQAREPLLAFIRARLAAVGGRIRINKDSGMFVAKA